MFLTCCSPRSLEGQLKPANYVFVDTTRYTDATWFAQGLEPGRYIDPIAEDVLVIDYDVTCVNAYPQRNALNQRNVRIAPGHGALNRDRADNGLHSTRKLDEDAIPCRLDHSTVVLGDMGINHLVPKRF
jgi:hypothetical protein